jgi:hypothetical protein
MYGVWNTAVVKRISPDADNLDKHFGGEEDKKRKPKRMWQKRRDSKAWSSWGQNEFWNFQAQNLETPFKKYNF